MGVKGRSSHLYFSLSFVRALLGCWGVHGSGLQSMFDLVK